MSGETDGDDGGEPLAGERDGLEMLALEWGSSASNNPEEGYEE